MGRQGIVEDRFGIAQDRYGSLLDRYGPLWIFLGIGLGRYGVGSELFELVYGLLGFVKNHGRILGICLDLDGSLWDC